MWRRRTEASAQRAKSRTTAYLLTKVMGMAITFLPSCEPAFCLSSFCVARLAGGRRGSVDGGGGVEQQGWRGLSGWLCASVSRPSAWLGLRADGVAQLMEGDGGVEQ